MSFLIQYLWSNIPEASRKRMQLFFGRVKVFRSVASSYQRNEPSPLNEPHIPKSAITISESWSFVRYKIFSGLKDR